MKIIEILKKYGLGLLASGNILLILFGIVLIIFGFILASITYIFKIGFKLFIIFLDEALYFSNKGLEFLRISVSGLKVLLDLLFYYLIRFIENLNLNIDIPDKPKVDKKCFLIIWYIIKSIFFYSISFLIILISVYWLITYIELTCKIIYWILSAFSIESSIIDYLNHFFENLNSTIFSVFHINIFNLYSMWTIRIIAFLSIFSFRYFRLRKKISDLTFKKSSPFWEIKPRIKNKKKIDEALTIKPLDDLDEILAFKSRDELFDKATSICVQEKKITLSMLQLKLNISKKRTQRIIKELEIVKIISKIKDKNGFQDVLIKNSETLKLKYRKLKRSVKSQNQNQKIKKINQKIERNIPFQNFQHNKKSARKR